ncbi:uncharacterized protein LOC112203378 [Rosa chinensis]|uniref:uncharacterized protein LOC112203378 n=1 Tax=Rosa chinensis TaxID=74649 RepID=UPI000D091542|nr:uncharacterized protein LOC112203378 [Rosa chinensis]
MIRAANQRPNLEEAYQGPFPPHITQTPYPRGYKNITFSTFSGEEVENAAAHLVRFRVQCDQYQNDDNLKCNIFATSLSGSAFTWFTKLQPGSVASWPAMEKLFKETFGTIEPEVDLASLTQMAQQPTESAVMYLQRFQIQKGKLNVILSEKELVKLAIKGLEPRQRKKQHGSMFNSMGELITEVGSFEHLLREMDAMKNASKGTYIPGKHPIVAALSHQSSSFDPYYKSEESSTAEADESEEDEIAALELTGKKAATLKQLKLCKEPVKLKSVVFTKPEFASYTYDANKAYEILDEMIAAKMVKTDFGPFPKPEQLRGKKYCKLHNMWNHNTADCVKLKDHIQI